MTEGYGDDPQSRDDRERYLEGLVTEAKATWEARVREERQAIEDARLDMRCPYCTAEPGEWCTVAWGTTRGRRASFLHEARGHVFREVARRVHRTGEAWAHLATHQEALRAYRRAR